MQQTKAPGLVPQAQGILEEHRQLRERLEKLRAALSPPHESEPPAAWLAGLAACLRELLPFLRAHFQEEETSGLFERIEQTWPHATRDCARLRGEHQTLLSRLEALGADCAGGRLGEEERRALAGRVRSLCEDVSGHEERENELLARSLDDAMAAQD